MYGIRQGAGQLNIVRNAKPINHYLANNEYPDSLKKKLALVEEIKQYCKDSLGLVSGENYSEMFDQQGQPGMYVLTGSKKYELSPYQWSFPFLGKFSYKGFFDLEKAKKEQKNLRDNGYDTDLAVVNAWSTLGWFKDPVMSSMLNLSEGKLARVLTHEITHYNVFVKDDIQYNENLASFIGDKGGKQFLLEKYGNASPLLKDYLVFLHDLELFTQYMITSSAKLAAFYSNLNPEDPKSELLKKEKIRAIILGLRSQNFQGKKLVNNVIANIDSINNTFFTDFLTYRKENKKMEQEFQREYQSNIKLFVAAQKEKYAK